MSMPSSYYLYEIIDMLGSRCEGTEHDPSSENCAWYIHHRANDGTLHRRVQKHLAYYKGMWELLIENPHAFHQRYALLCSACHGKVPRGMPPPVLDPCIEEIELDGQNIRTALQDLVGQIEGRSS